MSEVNNNYTLLENLKNIDNVRVGFGILNKTDSIITKFQTFLADIIKIYKNDANLEDLENVIKKIAKTSAIIKYQKSSII